MAFSHSKACLFRRAEGKAGQYSLDPELRCVWLSLLLSSMERDFMLLQEEIYKQEGRGGGCEYGPLLKSSANI